MTPPPVPLHVIVDNQPGLDTWAHGTDIAVVLAAVAAFIAIPLAIWLSSRATTQASKLASDAAALERKDRRYTFELGLLAQMSRDIGARRYETCFGPIRALIRDPENSEELKIMRGYFKVQNTPECDTAWEQQLVTLTAKHAHEGAYSKETLIAKDRDALIQGEIASAIETRVALDQ
jgi:hypothetical protein